MSTPHTTAPSPAPSPAPRHAGWLELFFDLVFVAAHALIALRFGRPLRQVAVWAVPGIGIPLLVVLGADTLAPWLVVLLLGAEAIGHLLYAKALARRRSALPG
ncbi:hypothetical protein [Streptomyces sp. NBC_01353]|uniref:hypothetical protein n=1 Tax=Streptomyces sp. NBC_01353 TaxID=2903835 RepID=UPI002E2F5CEB|nr:hypothetical protein [Streptomyces sp. NBC_01353]